MIASKALSELFSINDPKSTGQLDMQQLHRLYGEIRIGGISLAQVVASMDHVCGNSDYIVIDELKSTLEEMDRRYYLLQDLQWEFALLDNQHVGTISIEKTRFLFQAVKGKMFSRRKWDRFIRSRPLSDAPVAFVEIEVDLCNIPCPDDWDMDDLEDDDVIAERRKVEDRRRKEEENKRRKEKQRRKEEERRKKAEERQNEEQRRLEEERLVAMRQEKQKAALLAAQEKLQEEGGKEKADQNVTKPDEIPSPTSNDEDLGKKDAEVRRKTEEEKRRKAEEKDEKKRKKRDAKKQARADDVHRVYDRLEAAVESRDRDKLEPAIRAYKEKVPNEKDQDELLSRAQRLLEMLKCSGALKDAMARRLIADLETAIDRARKSGFDRSEQELAREITKADELLVRLRRLEKLRSEVLELKQSTIAELRSYHSPMPIIHKVMIATYLLLGVSEKDTKKWTNVQALLGRTGREGLKRRISQCNVLSISVATVTRARDLMGKVDLEAIRDVSAGAATFFVWTEGMIEEVMSTEEASED